jgi:uncharacterized protein
MSRHERTDLRVVLHGGEPLLAGGAVIDSIVRTIRTAVSPPATVDFLVQTNGLLLDEPMLELFHRHRIRVGVSIDGDRAANDRHRTYQNGRSSFDGVVHALDLLKRERHRPLYAGLLCTVDLRNDPVGTYESLLDHAPPRLDLLLPHGNWAHPPPQPSPSTSRTPYADWLIAVFDRWYSAPQRETGIRLFESLISRLLGGPSHTQVLGTDDTGLLTIDTDGSIEGSDALRTTEAGAATGLTVFGHSFDEALTHPVVSRHQGLSRACMACSVRAVCGAGLFAHRFSSDNGFDNPSVYCRDLYRLIAHVHARVAADVHRLRRQLLPA